MCRLSTVYKNGKRTKPLFEMICGSTTYRIYQVETNELGRTRVVIGATKMGQSEVFYQRVIYTNRRKGDYVVCDSTVFLNQLCLLK